MAATRSVYVTGIHPGGLPPGTFYWSAFKRIATSHFTSEHPGGLERGTFHRGFPLLVSIQYVFPREATSCVQEFFFQTQQVVGNPVTTPYLLKCLHNRKVYKITHGIYLGLLSTPCRRNWCYPSRQTKAVGLLDVRAFACPCGRSSRNVRLWTTNKRLDVEVPFFCITHTYACWQSSSELSTSFTFIFKIKLSNRVQWEVITWIFRKRLTDWTSIAIGQTLL